MYKYYKFIVPPPPPENSQIVYNFGINRKEWQAAKAARRNEKPSPLGNPAETRAKKAVTFGFSKCDSFLHKNHPKRRFASRRLSRGGSVGPYSNPQAPV